MILTSLQQESLHTYKKILLDCSRKLRPVVWAKMHTQSMISGTGEVAGAWRGGSQPSICLIGGRLAKKIARSVPIQWGLRQHSNWSGTLAWNHAGTPFSFTVTRLHVYSLRYDHVPWTCCARLLMCVLLLFACLSSLVFVLWLLLGRSPEWVRAACSSSFHLDLFKILYNNCQLIHCLLENR